jgi:nicotinamide-nucleotide amidase
MSLNKTIVSMLKKKKLKLAIAESCTGGLLSSAITSVNGSSKVFSMGLVTYSNQAKINILKVSSQVIKKYGAVSVQCCLAMINNLSKISKSRVCVSITGIAGPKGGSKEKPVGLVFIGIKVGKKIIINKSNFKNKGRIFIQKSTVRKALRLIENALQDLRGKTI